MKGSSCTLLASVLAASTVAISSTSYSADPQEKQFVSMDKSRSDDSGKQLPLTSSDKEKFRPRFDGMRFIETLVTAHR